MRRHPSPAIHTSLRSLASLLALIAILFVTLPCTASTPQPNAPAAACAPCCAPEHAITTPSLCCMVKAQPAESATDLATPALAPTAYTTSQPVPAIFEQLHSTRITTQTPSPPRPPSILRI